ncbi:MAG: PEP-CTERM sorting domain-containing protein [Pseudomonadales bacterium]|nr:PEP-CTERM sorting domain-containing protein [Pseudomonadales bacterium]
MKQILTASLLLGLSFATPSWASPIYEVDVDDPSQGSNAGYISSIKSQYNSNTDLFSWQHTIEDTASAGASDGFWLVVSDGPMPTNTNYTIFYGDLAANTVSAYQYDDSQKSNSWLTTSHYLTSYNLNYSHDGSAGTFSFDVNTDYLNDKDNFNNLDNPDNWLGTSFGDYIGVWFAPTLDTAVTYLANGAIDSASASAISWVDGSDYPTTEVPEPETGLLFILGLAGIYLKRK